MDNQVDIAVVGAGAAGLAAGIFAAEACSSISSLVHPRVLLLDGAKTIGAKILVSGGGRCNVTNDEVAPADFNGCKPIVRNILSAFPQEATCRWFASLGVDLKREDTGKLFPVTNQARTVLSALTNRCHQLGVNILTERRVLEISPGASMTDFRSTQSFVIRHTQGTVQAQRVIMATGGRSLPRTGSDGFGWRIIGRLGHTVTSTHPALVPLILAPSFFHAELSGLSHEAALTVFVNGKRIDRRSGSLLWTHFGVSGPVVMDSSRFWTAAAGAGHPVEVRCNFWPGMEFEEIDRWLLMQAKTRPKLSATKVLAQRVPDRLAEALCRWCDIGPPTPIAQLPQEFRRKLLHALTDLLLPVERDRGWNYAEVTTGGVPLEEINFRTMESRKVAGLYLIGEMLDCDGRIGGFNFQWAWSTGYLAGRSAAAALVDADRSSR